MGRFYEVKIKKGVVGRKFAQKDRLSRSGECSYTIGVALNNGTRRTDFPRPDLRTPLFNTTLIVLGCLLTTVKGSMEGFLGGCQARVNCVRGLVGDKNIGTPLDTNIRLGACCAIGGFSLRTPKARLKTRPITRRI